jgi:hypothetical protein
LEGFCASTKGDLVIIPRWFAKMWFALLFLSGMIVPSAAMLQAAASNNEEAAQTNPNSGDLAASAVTPQERISALERVVKQLQAQIHKLEGKAGQDPGETPGLPPQVASPDEGKKIDPFSDWDWTWLNGNPRTKDCLLGQQILYTRNSG